MLRCVGIIFLLEFSKYLENFSVIWSGIRYIGYAINSLAYFLLNHRVFGADVQSVTDFG